MKNILTILVLISGFWWTSCSPKSTGKVVEASTQPDTLLLVEEIPEPDTIIETIEEVIEEEPPKIELLASIRKTACYGNCPVFEAKIYSDGRVVYEGKQNVDRVGQFESWVSEDFIAGIYHAANKNDFLSMQTHYPEKKHFIPDFPNTVSYLKFEDEEKTVTNNHNAPVGLSNFESYFINLLENLEWKALTNQK